MMPIMSAGRAGAASDRSISPPATTRPTRSCPSVSKVASFIAVLPRQAGKATASAPPAQGQAARMHIQPVEGRRLRARGFLAAALTGARLLHVGGKLTREIED